MCQFTSEFFLRICPKCVPKKTSEYKLIVMYSFCVGLVCIFCFIHISTATTAWSRHRCGGNVSLDQELAGHISLTSSGPFSNTSATVTVKSTTEQPDETPPVSVCTWMISIPPGRTVLFKLLRLESGSSASVRCLGNVKDRVLEIDGSTLLSNCSRHKASISWTGEGHSSNPIELSYYGKKVSLDYPV